MKKKRIKIKQLETKTIPPRMENMLHDMNRSDVAEEKISKSEDVIIGNFQNKT